MYRDHPDVLAEKLQQLDNKFFKLEQTRREEQRDIISFRLKVSDLELEVWNLKRWLLVVTFAVLGLVSFNVYNFFAG